MPAFKPPHPAPVTTGAFTIFLAGSIDMGAAINWQQKVTEALAHRDDVVLFNPRRDEWDAGWEQDITNPLFREQVTWELDHLDRADLVAVYFDPNGKAPITLMELGLHATSGKCLVACPPGYWRRGNVQIVCERFGIPLLDNLDDFINAIINRCETA